ncbi:4192_t:CDS:2, partial [Entrophospora sp. SA101]
MGKNKKARQVVEITNQTQISHYPKSHVDGLKPDNRKELAYQAPQSLEAAINLAVRNDSSMWGIGNNNKSRTTNYNRPPPPPRDDGGPRPMDLDYIGESRNRNRTSYQQNKYSGNNNNNHGSNNNKDLDDKATELSFFIESKRSWVMLVMGGA